jgi:S1-C subfamily serine protease
MTEQGLAPVLVRLIGYLPGVDEPFDVSVRKASESADIALLSCECGSNGFSGIELSARPPSPGEEVIVMGYPTGLRSMLAQTGEEFLNTLSSAEELDFWDIARRLSANRFIRPLASRGIVGQVSDSAIVYDAETTHGGSGGPVINIDGQVVAVNTAIVPEYGGSNFGVPVRFVHELLDESRPIGH